MTTLLRSLLLVFLVLVCCLPVRVAQADGPQEGDVLFQTATSAQGEAIQLATRSPWSHVGIVLAVDGQLQVLEAAAPTVTYAPLQDWLQRGKDGRYAVLRPRAALAAAQLEELRKAAKRYLGKPDDPQFGWSNERIYCAELVWKLYRDAANIQLASLQRLRDLDLRNPVVKTLLAERFGGKPPLDEPVMTPAALFKSRLLREVQQSP